MVRRGVGTTYCYKGDPRAKGTAAAWLVFYALAVVASIIAHYSEMGAEVATAMGVWP